MKKERESMYCKQCGARTPDNASFCTECGERQNLPDSDFVTTPYDIVKGWLARKVLPSNKNQIKYAEEHSSETLKKSQDTCAPEPQGELKADAKSDSAKSEAIPDVEQEIKIPFDEVRAPWMIKLENAKERIAELEAQLALELQINANAKREADELTAATRQVRRLQNENARYRAEFEEYQDLGRKIPQLRAEVFSLLSQADNKKEELRNLEERIVKVKNDLKVKIRKSSTYKQVLFRLPEEKESALMAHAMLKNESLDEFINRAIDEAVLRDGEASDKDGSILSKEEIIG